MLLDSLKRSAAVVTFAAVLTTFAAGFAPAGSESAPPPRGGIRVVHHQPRLRPAFHQPRPVIHGPSMHRPGPRPMPVRWQHGPRVIHPRWQPAPPPSRPYYDRHAARRDRRIARGAAAVAILAALFGGR